MSRQFLTGRRRGDLWLIGGMLAIMAASAPWLRVYHRITSFELELARISADGRRTQLALPANLTFAEYWNRDPDELLRIVEEGFADAVAAERLPPLARGDRYALTIRYSPGSPARDRSATWHAP